MKYAAGLRDIRMCSFGSDERNRFTQLTVAFCLLPLLPSVRHFPLRSCLENECGLKPNVASSSEARSRFARI